MRLESVGKLRLEALPKVATCITIELRLKSVGREKGLHEMSKDNFDNEFEGQMSLTDLFEPPEKLFAVSRIFARARKEMSLAEQKTFVYALSELRFTEEATADYVKLDKKVLAGILGIKSDSDHLSVDIYENIRDLPKHSYIEINEKDLDLQSNGFIITAVTRLKNVIKIRFNREYLPLFTGLTTDYITMWSSDIFQMQSTDLMKWQNINRNQNNMSAEKRFIFKDVL